ncbi:MAG: hypothetical protein WCD20_12765 [Rhodomicrobium sp.]
MFRIFRRKRHRHENLNKFRERLIELGINPSEEYAEIATCGLIGGAFARLVNGNRHLKLPSAMTDHSITVLMVGLIAVDMAAQISATEPFELAAILIPPTIFDEIDQEKAADEMGAAFHEATHLLNRLRRIQPGQILLRYIASMFASWALKRENGGINNMRTRLPEIIQLVGTLRSASQDREALAHSATTLKNGDIVHYLSVGSRGEARAREVRKGLGFPEDV